MKRKLIEKLIAWKEKDGHKPLILFGARQVGKTYLVHQFAKQYYQNIYEINFEITPEAKWIFEDNLTIDALLTKLSGYMPNIPINKKTLLFFDEVQKCPQVLTALKSFALDKRFDVIVSGSMLGIIMDQVSSYPVGYVETLKLYPLSFEEFLWAHSYSEKQILGFKEYFDKEILVPEIIHQKLCHLFKCYVIVGGMPEVVDIFVKTKNINEVLTKQKEILSDYQNDISKYSSASIRQKVRECFDAIPEQLAKENKKFQYKLVKEGGNARHFQSSLNWISDSGIGFKVNRLKTFDIPLKAYRDLASFKYYFNDTGLLLSFYEENVQGRILQGDVGVFKGGIFENVIAQSLLANNMPIYYYRKDDRLEIDFVTYYRDNIVPIEVKSGSNTKSKSLLHVLESNKLSYGIKLSFNNINCTNPKLKCFPLYTIMFIR